MKQLLEFLQKKKIEIPKVKLNIISFDSFYDYLNEGKDIDPFSIISIKSTNNNTHYIFLADGDYEDGRRYTMNGKKHVTEFNFSYILCLSVSNNKTASISVHEGSGLDDEDIKSLYNDTVGTVSKYNLNDKIMQVPGIICVFQRGHYDLPTCELSSDIQLFFSKIIELINY